MTSLIKIRKEVDSKEEGIAYLKKVISDMENGLIEGEGWEVLTNAFD